MDAWFPVSLPPLFFMRNHPNEPAGLPWERPAAAWATAASHSATWDWAAVVDADQKQDAVPVAAVRHPLYKTRPCRNWMAHGKCPYGRRCQFAHGSAQLRARA